MVPGRTPLALWISIALRPKFVSEKTGTTQQSESFQTSTKGTNRKIDCARPCTKVDRRLQSGTVRGATVRFA